jgi:beta-alanine degradation protein BauB
MRATTTFRVCVIVAAIRLVTGDPMVFCQDPVRVASKNVKVVFENDRVRVLEVRIKPGEKLPMHSHPPHLTYTLSHFKGKYVAPDGEATMGEGKASAWSWTEAITHASENVGTTEIHALAIELKEPPKRKASAGERPKAASKK